MKKTPLILGCKHIDTKDLIPALANLTENCWECCRLALFDISGVLLTFPTY